MTAQLTVYKPATVSASTGIEDIKALVLDALTSEHSRRAYDRALTHFLDWYSKQKELNRETGKLERPMLSKAIVRRYAARLQGEGKSPSTINLRLSAIRKLATEAADNGLLDPALAAGITRVKGVTNGGRRSGNWLTKEQAQDLLDAPDTSTLKGLRDRAALAVLLGAGLRREEATSLDYRHIQQRDGRWCFVDIVGKRNKVRTVPIASWVKVAIDAWALAVASSEGYLDPPASGRVFRAVNKGGKVWGDGVTPQALWDVVTEYAGALGLEVTPHDLRRTFAKLAYRGGAGIDQIQLSLGHASIRTTERYLGVEQDLTSTPGDLLGLRL